MREMALLRIQALGPRCSAARGRATVNLLQQVAKLIDVCQSVLSLSSVL